MYNIRFEAVKNSHYKIFRPFWPPVSRLSFVSVSVTKIATIRHNYSLASGILRNILKACWPRCAFGRLFRTKQQIFQCLNSVDSAVLGKVCEFSSVYALRWNKVLDSRDHIGQMDCFCKWLMVLVDLPTGCSRRLLLPEYNVYLLICFVESVATHSSHNSYKFVMTGLLGESSEGSAVSSKPPSLITNFVSDHLSLMNVIFLFITLWFNPKLALK